MGVVCVMATLQQQSIRHGKSRKPGFDTTRPQPSTHFTLLAPHLSLPGTTGHYRTLSTTVTEVGPCPAAKGEPGTAVNAPDDLFTTKPETLFPGAGPVAFTTYRNVPERSKLSKYG